jgi:hypothetical protein
MTAGLTRTAIIQYAIQHGIADYIVSNYLSARSDEDIDCARHTITHYAGLAAPHVAQFVENALQRADEHHAADIRVAAGAATRPRRTDDRQPPRRTMLTQP